MNARHADILRFVDSFGQLDSKQIQALLFGDAGSETSFRRAQKALVAEKYLIRMGQRSVVGHGRGTGPAVYQLGANGWLFLGKRGKYSRPRFSAVSEHRLKVADAFVQLCEQEDAGAIKIRGYYTEPDTHMKLAGVTVRPDFFADIELIATSEQLRLWIEVDRDKENRPEIERKIRDYVAVYRGVTKAEIDPVPEVLFLADTDLGLVNLKNYMHGKLGEYEHLFTVDHIEGYAARLK